MIDGKHFSKVQIIIIMYATSAVKKCANVYSRLCLPNFKLI